MGLAPNSPNPFFNENLFACRLRGLLSVVCCLFFSQHPLESFCIDLEIREDGVCIGTAEMANQHF